MNNKKALVMLGWCCLAPLANAMQPLDEAQMSDVTGAGIGAAFDNVVIYSGDYQSANDFQLRLRLTDALQPEYLTLSELRFHRSGAEAGGINSGGFFGTVEDPFVVGDLRTITERHVGQIDPDGSGNYITGSRSHTAFYTGFPAADVVQKNRDFYDWSRRGGVNRVGVVTATPRYSNQSTTYARGLPNNFFSSAPSVNIGNLTSVSADYQAYLQELEDRLDGATDKFDLHFRLDAITDDNRVLGADNQFLAFVDVEGARLYGTSAYLWAHSNQGERIGSNLTRYGNNGAPMYADRGLAMAMTTGLRADVIRITADPRGVAGSQLELRGVDVYLPLGSVDQPLTISTVQFEQTQRNTWKNPVKLSPTTQLRMEIAGLPQDVAQAAQGNIFIQSLAFGDALDEEVITGRRHVHLRDASGTIVETVDNVVHRAFVPKTVTYNEQVLRYNQSNPNNPIPTIPNQNVVEIKGLEIQRLVITTQDLNR